MTKEYDTFIDDLTQLKEGEEVELRIRDLATYDSKKVKAIVASSKEKLPGADTLWLRFTRGLLREDPWAIKILEELGGPID